MAVEMLKDKESFVLVIKTDKYAGNFEREMCAFATGIDNEYAYDEASEFYRECGTDKWNIISNYIEFRMSDRGFSTCVSMWTDPESTDGAYNDVAIFFESVPNDQMLIDLVIKRCAKYCKLNGIKFLGAKWTIEKVKVTYKWSAKWTPQEDGTMKLEL